MMKCTVLFCNQQQDLFYVNKACMCLTFSLGYISTREKEVGRGDSVGGCGVGSGGR